MGFGDFLKKISPGYKIGESMGLWGGDDPESRMDGLEYHTDPDYRAAQDRLKGLGFDILDGNIPEYYKPIGESGGAELDNIINMSTRDITGAATESMARSGRARGGALPSTVARSVADNATKLRYADYLRSVEGKQSLLNTGIGVTEGVRSAGQAEGGNVNAFNTGKAQYLDAFDMEIGAQKGKALGQLASIALTAGGFMVGGPAGGAAGASIGQSLTGGGGGGTSSSLLDMFNSRNTGAQAYQSYSAPLPGVSRLGSINSKDLDLDRLYANAVRG